jgi:predicted transcriptional regulator
MTALIKDEAVKIVENLPDDATWEDLLYAVYVRQAIEEGIAEADAGLGFSTDEVRRHLGLES